MGLMYLQLFLLLEFEIFALTKVIRLDAFFGGGGLYFTDEKFPQFTTKLNSSFKIDICQESRKVYNTIQSILTDKTDTKLHL